MNLHKYDEAVSGYERIIQLNPRDPNAYVNLADIYCQTKDLDKAVANLTRAISLDPEHSARAHNLLGSPYLDLAARRTRKKSLRRP